MGLSLDPEPSCRCSLEQSGLWLCCWPQQCAFVGVTGPGRSNSPWAPDRREGQLACASLGLHALSPEGRAQLVARGPVLLVCTTVSPLPSVPPRWAAWQIFSLTGPAPAAALAQMRWSGDAQEHEDAPESSSGALCSAQPHILSPRTASGLHTPRGTWLGLSYIPLQLQPALSKFLCLMQGGETTQMSKGRAHGALSCWASGRLFL